MTDFALFVCGVVVTLIAGMGVLTSQVFMGYDKFHQPDYKSNKEVLEEV